MTAWHLRIGRHLAAPLANRRPAGGCWSARARRTLAVVAFAVLALPSCENMRTNLVYSVLGQGQNAANTIVIPEQPPKADTSAATVQALPTQTTGPAKRAPGLEYLQHGTGHYFAAPRRQANKSGTASSTTEHAQGVTLNFENTPVLEVVKVVVADLLGESYVVDPAVQGTVTLQTTKPIAKTELLPTLELLLRMNGAAIVWSDGVYHIVPRDSAIQGLLVPQLGDSRGALPRGYQVLIVPLSYVAAEQMQQMLEPFSAPGNVIRVDRDRNLLIIGGTGKELRVLLDTVEVFDVDWMAGQSMALFTPDFVDVKTLTEELNAIVGDTAKGPLAGLVRLVPIERLGALLVVSPRSSYIGPGGPMDCAARPGHWR